MHKKVALLHRYPQSQIKETNAAFPYLRDKGIDVLTFKKFNRLSSAKKFWKSVLWIFYAPLLVIGKKYDVIYCDDSYPLYPFLVKLASPYSRVVIRLGDLHLMYYTSGLLYRFLHFLELVAWVFVDEIIAISEPMADYIQSEIGPRPEVVLDPVDPADFPMRQGSPDTVMFHGVLTRNKNVDLLLEAAKLNPKVAFTVVGGGPDLQRLTGIAPRNVFFTGWVPFKDISSYIGSCAVGVALRSDNPGNEYVVTSPFLQYGVMGRPCLVTRRKVFGDYPWQFSSPEEMNGKLRELLKNPWEEGQKLKKRILADHDAKKVAEEIWRILMQR